MESQLLDAQRMLARPSVSIFRFGQMTPVENHIKARLWREKRNLSRRQLGELVGYSERTIAAFEDGQYGENRPITDKAYRTYRLACAAIAIGLQDFDWESIEIRLKGDFTLVENPNT